LRAEKRLEQAAYGGAGEDVDGSELAIGLLLHLQAHLRVEYVGRQVRYSNFCLLQKSESDYSERERTASVFMIVMVVMYSVGATSCEPAWVIWHSEGAYWSS
jgi:hypothetical protein